YSALGLEPGADAFAVERAYKSLIKQHHPDREGGDSARAAEINHAYRELRAALGSKDTLQLIDEPVAEARNRWVRAAVVLLVALVALLAVAGPVSAFINELLEPPPARADDGAAAGARGISPMDQPLHLAAVSGGVRDAVSMLGKHDDSALLAASRDCHRELRLEPSVTRLDRCAAFDDAVVQIEDRDPMWDQGPFSQIAVTGRQWSAASALSDDYLAIDSRLHRVRVQVELTLVPVA